MRNRAKCKLCESIIESTTRNDIVSCSCGEISVIGGSEMRCMAKDFSNFLRVDDNGNVIVPEIIEKKTKITFEELLEALDHIAKTIEGMPKHAFTVAINHYDYLSLLQLLSMLFKSLASRDKGEG